MKISGLVRLVLVGVALFWLTRSFQATMARAADTAAEARAALQRIYEERKDLQKVFDDSWKVAKSVKTKDLPTLEEWAKQYGYKEYPKDLLYYAPPAAPRVPPAIAAVPGVPAPVKKKGAAFDWRTVRSQAVFVIDSASHKTLLSRNSKAVRPIASLTKLMTATLALEKNVDLSAVATINAEDEVGGARLRLDDGTPIKIKDIFYATLVGSANNAANALARCTELSKDDFVTEMNVRAETAGLVSTEFADPSGIEPANVSTAEEVTALAVQAFGNHDIRQAASTAYYDIELGDGAVHKLKNTNQLLLDNNGIIVLAGKTGYLDESGWNLVVEAMDARRRPIIVTVLGEPTKARAFSDALRIARWAWKNHAWQK
jgi:D-alanyl-D-alanine endopeptidase (penicillin-binding protein 7)